MPIDPRQDPRRAAAAAAGAAAGGEPPPPAPPPPPQPVLFQPPPPPPSLPPPPQQQSILFQSGNAMDEDDDEDVNMVDHPNQQTQHSQSSALMGTAGAVAGGALQEIQPQPLPTRIITPSPYPQHTRGATSARFRNALSRVTTNPTSDSEAWSALLTEVQTCRQQLQPSLHSPSVETQHQLEFLVSCYGALLHYFPYAISQYVSLGELLLEASARPGEAGGPSNVHSAVDTQRAVHCEGQLETIFRTILGMKTGPSEFGRLHQPHDQQHTKKEEESKSHGSDSSNDPKEQAQAMEIELQFLQDKTNEALPKILGGVGTWSVDLWIVYLKKVQRDIQRYSTTLPADARNKWVRDKTVETYELALKYVPFSYKNEIIWKSYLEYVKSWTKTEEHDPVVQQQQMIQLRSIYQRLVQIPMTGLDQLWQDYETFERSHSEELAQALITEYTPKYQHARTVYLERARVYNYTGDLQLGRLATPPVTRNQQSSSAKEKGSADDTGATTQTQTTEEYLSSLQEEYQLLQAWKKRVSYERTNPERLLAADLPLRMRHAYLEMISVLTRHPEVWHMWSMYEYYHIHKPVRAMAVLQLGLQHIPDCTLLANAQAQLVENYCSSSYPGLALRVLDRFLQTSPNTLAFCLYQQLVRRYQGIEAARVVFAKARRALVGEFNKEKDQRGGDEKEETENGDVSHEGASKRWMVTNRLDPNVGHRKTQNEQGDFAEEGDNDAETDLSKPLTIAAGPITWHLYASHATIEHRLNHNPEVAARIYELGLRNHPQFLVQPPFVLRYAQLLLELNDSVNLRALLTRAVSAASDGDTTNGNIAGSTSQNKSTVAAVLWDMTLQFETILSGADPMASQHLEEVERKRHVALMGPDLEDVATGGFHTDSSANTTIGAQKSTISEMLVRNDGYDTSSMLVNGMARSVSVLEVMGLWGSSVVSSGVSMKRNQPNKSSLMEFLEEEEDPAERSGGVSDASYQRRLQYQRLHESGLLQTGSAIGGVDGTSGAGAAVAGNKMLTARERLATAGGGGAGGASNAAVNVAIQQQPEWVRHLLLMLPASKSRLAVLAKPPPHLVEMALLQLQTNALPSERPQDENGVTDGGAGQSTSVAGLKRKATGEDAGDSSDEEDDNVDGGGYGMQFRSRQRARQMKAGGELNGDLGPNQ